MVSSLVADRLAPTWARSARVALFRELLADRGQLLAARRGRRRVVQLEAVERIENDPRDDQACVLLVVGGHDIPGCELGAGRAQALLVRLHVGAPEFPLLDIGHAEFPVLLRLVDAGEK